jgi:hypothetical protein
MVEQQRDGPGAGKSTRLLGRRAECAVLDELLAGVRAGESRVLVVRGDAGVGKSALLDHAAESAPDMRLLRAGGVESEMELAFAALHQFCAPLVDRLAHIPGPQRAALETVFGLRAGPPPDRFLVGLAVLSLLSDVAEERPVLCVVDDAQWLDTATAQTLGFVARRLRADSVGLLLGAREVGDELRGLPELDVQGLPDDAARALLGSAVGFLIDDQVRDRILAETGGNPLALLELPRGLTATQLAGGFGVLGAACRPGSSGASCARSTRCRRRSGRSSSSPRPSRRATRCWCGGRPTSSASRPRSRTSRAC